MDLKVNFLAIQSTKTMLEIVFNAALTCLSDETKRDTASFAIQFRAHCFQLYHNLKNLTHENLSFTSIATELDKFQETLTFFGATSDEITKCRTEFLYGMLCQLRKVSIIPESQIAALDVSFRTEILEQLARMAPIDLFFDVRAIQNTIFQEDYAKLFSPVKQSIGFKNLVDLEKFVHGIFLYKSFGLTYTLASSETSPKKAIFSITQLTLNSGKKFPFNASLEFSYHEEEGHLVIDEVKTDSSTAGRLLPLILRGMIEEEYFAHSIFEEMIHKAFAHPDHSLLIEGLVRVFQLTDLSLPIFFTASYKMLSDTLYMAILMCLNDETKNSASDFPVQFQKHCFQLKRCLENLKYSIDFSQIEKTLDEFQ